MSSKSALYAETKIDNVLSVFNNDINAHPEKFVQEDQELETKLTKITKTLFDLGKYSVTLRLSHYCYSN